MNEITHEQARSLMQAEADGQLDESGMARQEWANLHAHLESCTPCRTQQRRLRTLQRELHAALRSGLDVHQPPPVSIQPLVDAREAREQRKRRLTRIALILPAALLALAIAWWFRVDLLLVALLDPWGTAAKEFYGSFDGQIVYESRLSNDADLYLLQGGASPLKLTDDPAEDSDPVWSPDGQWIAFLSDRAPDPLNVRAIEPREQLYGANMLFPTATPLAGEAASKGKREIFVLSPGAGQPALQISAENNLAWLAPLSWSVDGKHIAAAGKLLPALIDNQNIYAADTWVYTLSLDGSGAQRMAGTRGANQVRYAPNGGWLGFQRLYLDQRQFTFVQPAAQDGVFLNMFNLDPTNEGVFFPGAVFTWSPGGSDMAYLTEGPYIYRGGNLQPSNRAVSQLRRVIGFPGSMPTTAQGRALVELPLADGLQDVAWSPDGSSVVLLQGSAQDPCWSLLVGRLPQVAGTEMQIYPVEGLCAGGQLSARPWTPDGRWLVFGGRWHGEKAAIYALDVQQAIEHPNYAPLVARLTEADLADHNPQVQPDFPDMGISPQPIATADRPALSDAQLAQVPGWLVSVAAANGSNAGQTAIDLWVVGPGSIHQQAPSVMVSSTWQPGALTSPAVSPAADGAVRLAWVQAGAASGEGNDQHLYLAEQKESVVSTPVDLTPQGLSGISTPSWSPDGQRLAAVLRVVSGPGAANGTVNSQLAIFDGSGDTSRTDYIYMNGVEFLGPVAWTAGGRIAALVRGQPFGGSTRYNLALAMIDLDLDHSFGQALILYQPVEGLEPQQVTGMAWSIAADGSEQVAVLGSVEEAGMVTPRVVTLRADASQDGRVSRQAWFAEYALAPGNRPALDQPLRGGLLRGDRLRWRPGTQQFSLVVNENTGARVVVYPAQGGPAETLLTWDEPIYQHAWSPDGQWLALAGESGVWLVSLAAPDALPFRLISVGGWDLDWR